jgi:hypothetical protein
MRPPQLNLSLFPLRYPHNWPQIQRSSHTVLQCTFWFVFGLASWHACTKSSFIRCPMNCVMIVGRHERFLNERCNVHGLKNTWVWFGSCIILSSAWPSHERFYTLFSRALKYCQRLPRRVYFMESCAFKQCPCT